MSDVTSSAEPVRVLIVDDHALFRVEASLVGDQFPQLVGAQVLFARVGITANQGLFGHGSAVLLSR